MEGGSWECSSGTEPFPGVIKDLCSIPSMVKILKKGRKNERQGKTEKTGKEGTGEGEEERGKDGRKERRG